LWLCNESVNTASLLIAGTPLTPLSVRLIEHKDRHHEDLDERELWKALECRSSTLLELSYNTSLVWMVLGTPATQPPKGMMALLSGYNTAGTPLLGYASVVFRHDEHREGD
jgi:hypothetical protein